MRPSRGAADPPWVVIQKVRMPKKPMGPPPTVLPLKQSGKGGRAEKSAIVSHVLRQCGWHTKNLDLVSRNTAKLPTVRKWNNQMQRLI